MRTERLVPALKRRLFGVLALYIPGSESVRVGCTAGAAWRSASGCSSAPT
ncbi:MAG: hypothetical protein R2736_06990 [Solirubrobacterales bacterium]